MSAQIVSDTDRNKINGRCPCGTINFTLNGPPLFTYCCYCMACQRETGTAFALNTLIETSRITLLPPMDPLPQPQPILVAFRGGKTPSSSEGSDVKPGGNDHIAYPVGVLTPSESGKGQTIFRCPKCWSAVWSCYGGAGAALAFVRTGCIDYDTREGECAAKADGDGNEEKRKVWGCPNVHIYTGSKVGWLDLEGGKRTDGKREGEEGTGWTLHHEFYDAKHVWIGERGERLMRAKMEMAKITE